MATNPRRTGTIFLIKLMMDEYRMLTMICKGERLIISNQSIFRTMSSSALVCLHMRLRNSNLTGLLKQSKNLTL